MGVRPRAPRPTTDPDGAELAGSPEPVPPPRGPYSSSGVSCTGSLVNWVSKLSRPYSSVIWGWNGGRACFFSSWEEQRKVRSMLCHLWGAGVFAGT